MAFVRKRGWVLLLAAGVGAGFIPWKVTAPARWLCGRVSPDDLRLMPRSARWTPWSRLELSDVEVQARQGGHLRLMKVSIWPRLWTLAGGRWITHWEFGEVRMDPGSWGIRGVLAQGILSAEPVIAEGFAVLEFGRQKATLHDLRLNGPLLHLQAKGWIQKQERAELALKGELQRNLLEGMLLLPQDSSEPRVWESFHLQVRGALAAPEVRFVSSFFTFAMNVPAERNL